MFSEWNDTRAGSANFHEGPVYPPKGVLFVIAGLLAVAAALLIVPSDLAHWAGYALSAIVCPILVVTYRHITRERGTQRSFVAKPAQARTATAMLAVGVLLALANAFVALQDIRIR